MTLDKAIERLQELRKVYGGNVEIGTVDEYQEEKFDINFYPGKDCFGSDFIEVG